MKSVQVDKDDALLLKAVVLYILKKNDCPGANRLDKTSVYGIVKTAYLAQQKHLAKYLCALFSDTIVALKYGPVPSNLYDALKMARGDKDVIALHKNDFLHLVSDAILFEDECFSAKESPDTNYLSSAAVECLDAAIEEIDPMTFNDLVQATHKNAWSKAYHSNNKEMSLVDIAEEGGASDAALEYIAENERLNGLLK